MPMLPVIEDFNVVEHALSVWLEIGIDAVVCLFVLQAPEEPFGHQAAWYRDTMQGIYDQGHGRMTEIVVLLIFCGVN